MVLGKLPVPGSPINLDYSRARVGGRVVRWCWVNFQCRGVLLISIRVGQGPTALAVGAGGVCLDIFTLIYPFFPLSPSLWGTARYRLKYGLEGPLSPKPTKKYSRARAYCAYSTCGWGFCSDIFSLIYHFSSFSLSLCARRI